MFPLDYAHDINTSLLVLVQMQVNLGRESPEASDFQEGYVYLHNKITMWTVQRQDKGQLSLSFYYFFYCTSTHPDQKLNSSNSSIKLGEDWLLIIYTYSPSEFISALLVFYL